MARFIAAFVVVFLIFHLTAAKLGSDRGESGVIIAAIVTAALIAAERLLFQQHPLEALHALGFGRPSALGLAVAIGIGVLLLALLPVYSWTARAEITALPGWLFMLPGLFAQGGIAEEALFRGYLFGHLHKGRPFWRAAMLATIPFVIVHLLLFATMPWPIALASLLLATVISFPLARLFELGGNTIWAPALLHFVVQGSVKVIALPDALFPVLWMAAAAAIPFLVFLTDREPDKTYQEPGP